MGWRGVVRSIAAAQRAAERESARRHRQLVREAKEDAKRQMLRAGALEVEEFESFVERLTSVHRDCSDAWDWKRVHGASEPLIPAISTDYADAAKRALAQYKPGFLDRVLRREATKKERLRQELARAVARDKTQNSVAATQYAEAKRDWLEMRTLAERVLAGDVQAFADAVEEGAPFEELADLGSPVELRLRPDFRATAIVHVNSESVVPSETKALLQSGKLSVKRMPTSRYNELYQDYVAGATLRVARELLALLPLSDVIVTAVARQVDTASGHLADMPLLSVRVPRETLATINFARADASDALRNFDHRMSFSRTKGFSPIDPVDPSIWLQGGGAA